MNRRETLLTAVAEAEAALAEAEAALYAFAKSAENNIFDTLYEAGWVLEQRLHDEASEDCEGAYNYGNPEYTQEFIVGGKKYLATLKVEYNRHDKTYYYVEETNFSVKEVE